MKLSFCELPFYGREIAELILLKERQESKLYYEVVKELEDAEVAHTLQALARISESYQQSLKQWCSNLEPYPVYEGSPGQHDKYMKSLANQAFRSIYPSGLQKVISKTEVGKTIISAERSFVAYLRTYQQYISRKDYDVFKEAIRKQKEHCDLISTQCERCQ